MSLADVFAHIDDEKTENQRTREQQLIRELLEVVDERERLDQRLTTTTTQ